MPASSKPTILDPHLHSPVVSPFGKCRFLYAIRAFHDLFSDIQAQNKRGRGDRSLITDVSCRYIELDFRESVKARPLD